MPNTSVAVQTTVAVTGAVGAGLDISAMTGDETLHVRIQSMTAASGIPGVILQIEDSVNAFAAVIPQWVIQAKGTVSPTIGQSGIHLSKRLYEIPWCRFGTASAVLRPNVTAIKGTTPSLTIDCWIET